MEERRIMKNDKNILTVEDELDSHLIKMNLRNDIKLSNNIITNSRNLNDDQFDLNGSIISAHLSALAYCENRTIINGNYSLFQLSTISEKDIFPISLKDFTVKNSFHNDDHDVLVFIGFSIELKSIFVVFRGSTSISNWLNNFDTIKTDFPICDG